MLHIKDNWGTTIANGLGFANWFGDNIFGSGKNTLDWDLNSLTPVWGDEGGWLNEIWPNPTGAYSQLATDPTRILHEGVHVMQSKFWGNSIFGTGWLPLYFFNHLNPFLEKINPWIYNYFERQAYSPKGWRL